MTKVCRNTGNFLAAPVREDHTTHIYLLHWLAKVAVVTGIVSVIPGIRIPVVSCVCVPRIGIPCIAAASIPRTTIRATIPATAISVASVSTVRPIAFTSCVYGGCKQKKSGHEGRP
jgi:hypothetical protein